MTGNKQARVGTRDLVYDLAFAPTSADDGICYAARRSGLYRSSDSGRHWHTLYDSLELSTSLMTSAVAVAPDFADDSLLLAGIKGGILRTADDGQSWRVMLLPPPAPLVTTVVFSPSFPEDGTVLIGTFEDGIFCSTDRGVQWAAWNFGLLDLSVYGIAFSPDFARDQTVFAGTESGVFKSTNGGRSWRAVPFPSEAAPAVSLAVSDGGRILVGTEANGLFSSYDNGQNWERLAAAAIPDVVNVIMPGFPGQNSIAILLDTAILYSDDKGQTWQTWAELEHPAATMAGSLAKDIVLVGTTEGRILRLSN